MLTFLFRLLPSWSNNVKMQRLCFSMVLTLRMQQINTVVSVQKEVPHWLQSNHLLCFHFPQSSILLLVSRKKCFRFQTSESVVIVMFYKLCSTRWEWLKNWHNIISVNILAYIVTLLLIKHTVNNLTMLSIKIPEFTVFVINRATWTSGLCLRPSVIICWLSF